MKLGCSSTSAQSIGSFNFELELKFGCSPGVAAAAPQDPTANLKCPADLATAALAAPGPPGAAAATAATNRGWVTVAPAATSQLSVQLGRPGGVSSAFSSLSRGECGCQCGIYLTQGP